MKTLAPISCVRVSWYIDLEAADFVGRQADLHDSAVQAELALMAAKTAYDMATDPGTTATFWEVEHAAFMSPISVDLGTEGGPTIEQMPKRMPSWRPMDTAPKDGKIILVANFSADGKTMYWAATCSYNKVAMGFYVTGPWERRIEASHWMPVPATLDEV